MRGNNEWVWNKNWWIQYSFIRNHISYKKKERKKERNQTTPNWIENGHLEYVKYDSCLQSKIFFKKKNDKNYSNGHYHSKRGRDIRFFLSFAFSKLQKKTHVASYFRVRIAVLVVIWGHFFFLQAIFGFANTKRTKS